MFNWTRSADLGLVKCQEDKKPTSHMTLSSTIGYAGMTKGKDIPFQDLFMR